jgi:hypothetical protein
MALPRWLTHATGDVVGAVGAVTGSKTAKNVANAIVDPNVTLSNPMGLVTKAPAFTAAPRAASGGQAAAGGGSQAGADINAGGTGVSSGFDASGDSAQAAADAKHAANLQSLRSDIATFVSQLTGMYHDITGKIDTATSDAANQTVKTYADQEGSTTQQYNDQVPGLNFGYYANGIGDSTYRGQALDNAGNALKGSIAQIENNKTSDLQKIQQTSAAKKAGYAADEANLGNVMGGANIDDSESNLQGTRADLMTKMSATQADMPNYNTGAQFSADLKAAAPTKDVQPVIDALTKVIKGQAAQPIKQQVANQILNNSNLSDGDKKKLADQFGITG